MEKKDLIFGARAIIEALEAGKSLDKIMIRRDGGSDLIKELLDKTKFFNVPVQRVPIEKLDRITKKNHQGAIAIISPINYLSVDDIIPMLYEQGKTPLCIVLDGITDTRNFGSIARSCECAGADFIIIPEKGSASVTSDAVKASAGALFHIPVCRERDIKSTLKKIKLNGYKVVGASEKASENYTDISYEGPVAIVMGAEDTGISIEALKECDSLVSIPIKGKIGSLNVGVAAGIMLYEVIRQRRKNQ